MRSPRTSVTHYQILKLGWRVPLDRSRLPIPGHWRSIDQGRGMDPPVATVDVPVVKERPADGLVRPESPARELRVALLLASGSSFTAVGRLTTDPVVPARGRHFRG